MSELFEAFEKKIVESFRRVKSDIVKIWEVLENQTKQIKTLEKELAELKKEQALVIKNIQYLRAKPTDKPTNKENLKIILNKESGTAHKENCFFAKNILREHRAYYADEKDLKGFNYKKCSCMTA